MFQYFTVVLNIHWSKSSVMVNALSCPCWVDLFLPGLLTRLLARVNPGVRTIRGQIRGRYLVFLSEAELDLVTMVPFNLVLLTFAATPAFASPLFHNWFITLTSPSKSSQCLVSGIWDPSTVLNHKTFSQPKFRGLQDWGNHWWAMDGWLVRRSRSHLW